MGKNLIQQARGKGGPRYRAPSFRYKAKVMYPDKEVKKAKIVDFVKGAGHSAPLAEIEFKDGLSGYLIAAEGIKVGREIEFGEEAELKSGNTLPLKEIPIGTTVFNIEGQPGDGGKYVRSGGTTARVIAKKGDEVVVQLPSKKHKKFNQKCRASIGRIAGSGRKDKPFLKAGTRHHYMKARNKLYPRVCGTSMNAVDHPYGKSRSGKKGRPTIARRHAPPGAKVGKIRPRRTGKK
jgi:large subunit ribosomal protein L2